MLALELLHIYNGGNFNFYGLIQFENDNYFEAYLIQNYNIIIITTTRCNMNYCAY